MDLFLGGLSESGQGTSDERVTYPTGIYEDELIFPILGYFVLELDVRGVHTSTDHRFAHNESCSRSESISETLRRGRHKHT